MRHSAINNPPHRNPLTPDPDLGGVRQEKLPAINWHRPLVVSATCSLLLLVMLMYQSLVGPGGITSLLGWFSLVAFLSVVAVTVLLANCRHLVVVTTSDSLTVRFGRLKYRVRLRDVQSCAVNTSDALKQRTQGIRISRHLGRWRLAYTVADYPVVALELDGGLFEELVFSTNNPNRAKIIAEWFGGGKTPGGINGIDVRCQCGEGQNECCGCGCDRKHV
jgi:hypothetical protein